MCAPLPTAMLALAILPSVDPPEPAGDELVLVPISIEMTITTRWSRLVFDDCYVVVLDEAAGPGPEPASAQGTYTHFGVKRWNAVVVGGFGPRHVCRLGKTKGGFSTVRMRLGHDNFADRPIMTIHSADDVAGDPENWRSFTLDIPESLRGDRPLKAGLPNVGVPAIPFERKVLRYYRPGRLEGPAAPSPDLRRDVRALKERGGEWIVYEWDGPDSPSDRLLRQLLPIAQEESVGVVVSITCLKSRRVLLEWVECLLGDIGQHPAAARVGGKPVLLFSRQTCTYFSETMWEAFFREVRARGLGSFNLVEDDQPRLIRHFDGLYSAPTSESGATRLRVYVQAYVHARFRQKVFAAPPPSPTADGLTPAMHRLLAGCRPTWVLCDDLPAGGALSAVRPTPSRSAPAASLEAGR